MILCMSPMSSFSMLLLFLLPILLCVWALVDILKSKFKDDTTKIIWVIIVILLPILGSILYFILGKEHKAL